MTQITIEMVDDVMERLPNVSYKDAKEALIKTDGNVLDAIILLDGDKKFSISAIKKDGLDNIGTKFTAETEKLRRQTIELLKTAKRVRLIVDSEERTVLNLPLGVGILGIATLPIPTVLGLSAAVLTNCTVKIADENSDDQVEFGVMTPEKMDMLKEILTNSFDEVKKTLENKKETKKDNDDDSDITDELLNEENK